MTGRVHVSAGIAPHGQSTCSVVIACSDARLLSCVMATQKRTVDHLLEQAAGAGAVSARPMFGEYGLYVDGKIVGSICDDRLYLKPTEAGRRHAAPVPEAPPYPGAKPHLLIEADRWDDAEWLSDLLRRTTADLPAPKSRKSKRSLAG